MSERPVDELLPLAEKALREAVANPGLTSCDDAWYTAAVYRRALIEADKLNVQRLARALREDDDHSLGGVERYMAEAQRLAEEYAVAGWGRDE